MNVRAKMLLGASLVLAFAVWGFMAQSSRSQPPAEPVPEAKPPADATYVGYKACMACHLKESLAWKKTKHFTEAFPKLPEKYKTDASCLACHSTGYGTASGYDKAPDNIKANLEGTTCEACHGPSSAHVAAAKPFIAKKPDAEQTKAIKATIYKVQPGNVCVRCHTDQGHKAHPAYDK